MWHVAFFQILEYINLFTARMFPFYFHCKSPIVPHHHAMQNSPQSHLKEFAQDGTIIVRQDHPKIPLLFESPYVMQKMDFIIQGAWQPQVEELLDIHVIDTDASSYC